MISGVLAPAVQLWLRSQLDQVEGLKVDIAASDRQLLSGQLPWIRLWAERAVYQGLHLSQADLVGQKIRVNLGQVLRGHALQLLEPIPIAGEIRLAQADLDASCGSPLLVGAIADLLGKLRAHSPMLQAHLPASPFIPRDLKLVTSFQQLTLKARLKAGDHDQPITLKTGLELADEHRLRLVNPHWFTSFTDSTGIALTDLDGFEFDLGDASQLHQLALTPEGIRCQGRLWVVPVEG